MIRQQSSGSNLFAELDDGDAAELDSASLLENFHAGKCPTQGNPFQSAGPSAMRNKSTSTVIPMCASNG